jgi:hypothetical protein
MKHVKKNSTSTKRLFELRRLKEELESSRKELDDEQLKSGGA